MDFGPHRILSDEHVYTTARLTRAEGWVMPSDHPNRADIMPVSVGTDAGAALKTRKGTGVSGIPRRCEGCGIGGCCCTTDR